MFTGFFKKIEAVARLVLLTIVTFNRAMHKAVHAGTEQAMAPRHQTVGGLFYLYIYRKEAWERLQSE
jgi:hypothetical protein